MTTLMTNGSERAENPGENRGASGTATGGKLNKRLSGMLEITKVAA